MDAGGKGNHRGECRVYDSSESASRSVVSDSSQPYGP